jgi:hypothetical protein
MEDSMICKGDLRRAMHGEWHTLILTPEKWGGTIEVKRNVAFPRLTAEVRTLAHTFETDVVYKVDGLPVIDETQILRYINTSVVQPRESCEPKRQKPAVRQTLSEAVGSL